MLASGSSGDRGHMASAAFKLGVGDWVFSLDGLRRESGDYEVPVEQVSRRLAQEEGLPPPLREAHAPRLGRAGRSR